MIARSWHGIVNSERAGEYEAYLQATGVTDLRATTGNLGVDVMRRDEGAETHFVLISYWESEDAIRAFAGDEVERARYYDDDPNFLLELELTCTHYHVVTTLRTHS